MHTEFRRDQRIKRVRLFLKNKNNIKEKNNKNRNNIKGFFLQVKIFFIVVLLIYNVVLVSGV